MHKKVLVITQGANKLEANQNALKICDKLIENKTDYDWYLPINQSERFETCITETMRIDNLEVIKEIEESLKSGLEVFQDWLDSAGKQEVISTKIRHVRHATSNTTFNVFDGTVWSEGDFITDISDFDKIVNYLVTKTQLPIWISAFDMHF